MSRNDDYAAENILDYLHYENYYKCIGIDLSRPTNTTSPQEIKYLEKPEEGNSRTTSFIAEKQQKTILNFSLNSLKIIE